jgi:hypothetical protein
MVFAGAQDLYAFCEDITSPIGSRAAFYIVPNLDVDSVGLIVDSICEKIVSADLKALISRMAGGQAGLTIRLAMRGDDLQKGNYADVLSAQKGHNNGLLRTWALSLTNEARLIQDRLLEIKSFPVHEIPGILQQGKMDRFLGDRVVEELVFTGIAIHKDGHLVLVNELYGAYAKDFILPPAPTDEETTVWSIVEETEIALREIVRKKYESRWRHQVEARYRDAIGVDSWDRVLENKTKGERAYKYSKPQFNDPLLDFAYLGQLVQMIISNAAWDMFKHLFRDKRQLEDIVADITPVRNDHAHFRRVPERELLRCRLRCEDLLYLLEQDV